LMDFGLCKQLSDGFGLGLFELMFSLMTFNESAMVRAFTELGFRSKTGDTGTFVLIARRIGFGKGTKPWDLVWVVLWAPVMIAVYVVAVIELGWVSVTPGAAWLLGLAIFVSGWALLIWSSVVNPFLEKTVRIQTEHGHRVIETGPYAYVRHPFYVGLALWMLSTPLLLISTWAFIPAVLAVVGLMIRTALEDRTLHRELPGYADYTVRIRFRLIPGVW
ncbi:MAG TPA: isoprenylcysteine carboxylmethyltransferase family protein, partial [Gemmatimonadetes bacterium]|nr:isoprenylcysteine carboxylmethyltransferase family protein [Gemmatimonadota bacterium]